MTATHVGVECDRERQRIYERLADDDAALARLIARYGQPDPFFWGVLEEATGGDAYAELALHIVSQQISTAAALTIFGRLRSVLNGKLDPTLTSAATVEELRAAGLSGAKARSLRDLAERLLDDRLSFDRLAASEDAAAQAELEQVRGIGPWSAQMFLLHNLRRPDVFPAGDVGLLRAAQSALALAQRPTAAALAERAERWRPFRSYAAALLWAHSAEHATATSTT